MADGWRHPDPIPSTHVPQRHNKFTSQQHKQLSQPQAQATTTTTIMQQAQAPPSSSSAAGDDKPPAPPKPIKEGRGPWCVLSVGVGSFFWSTTDRVSIRIVDVGSNHDTTTDRQGL
jgi:hypothetical protein